MPLLALLVLVLYEHARPYLQRSVQCPYPPNWSAEDAGHVYLCTGTPVLLFLCALGGLGSR